jgi:hypothetical protein
MSTVYTLYQNFLHLFLCGACRKKQRESTYELTPDQRTQEFLAICRGKRLEGEC